MKKLDDENLKKILFGLYYLKNKVKENPYALEITVELIGYVEDHFGIKKES